MAGVMLTARDEDSGRILDLTALSDDERSKMHGHRTARRHGYGPVCKHCGQGVHMVVNHHRTAFWRHNPGMATRCVLAEVSAAGESAEHLDGKVAIVGALRSLRGWSAEPERRFERNGELVIVDVYAEHEQPEPHQTPTAWEVQMSPQTGGAFTLRSDERQRVAGIGTSWITPHDDALGRHQGIIVDRTAQLIVGRLYASPYTLEPLAPMPTGAFVKAVARRHRRLYWTDSGEDRRFIAYPPESLSSVGTPHRSKRSTVHSATDRPCDRIPNGPSPPQLGASIDDAARRLERTWPGAEIRIVPFRDGYLVEAWRQPIGKVDVRVVRTSGGY
jgi:uncharacterized protein YkuJ